MTSAFQLDYSGPPVRCDFPGCTGNAWHEGDHVFAPKPQPERHFDQHCVVCGRSFTVYGAGGVRVFQTCGEQACVLHFARHHATAEPLRCPCPQRPYPHELKIHFELRSEAYNPKLKFRWPWSLCLSPRLEMSAERKHGA
jgi:hypothetical protein